jgi:hypothetical protein
MPGSGSEASGFRLQASGGDLRREGDSIPRQLGLRLRAGSRYAATLIAGSGDVVAEVEECTSGIARLASRALGRTALREALPFELRVGALATLRRGLSLLRPAIEVRDAGGALLGELRQRLWASGGAFDALDASGRRVAGLRLEGVEDGGGAARLESGGRTLAWLAPARGPERRLEVAAEVEEAHALLLVAALSALDRVLAG